MKEMTGKERILLAMRNQKPDRVPVVPDISNMVPARLTGKPFWDIFFHENPPIGAAYMDAADYFGMDATYVSTPMSYIRENPPERETMTRMENGRLAALCRHKTRLGDLTQETTYFSDNPPTLTKKLVESVEDIERFKCLFSPILSYKRDHLDADRERLGDRGAFGLSVDATGLQTWFNYFNGGLEELTWLLYDEPEIIMDLKEFWDKDILRQVEMILDYRPDFLYFQSSGGITLQSPQLFRQLTLDVVREATRMAKEAGIPTLLHSCGKEMCLVKMLSEETDLSCINPLETPPMGDCDLAEAKRLHGGKIALMGNLNTSGVLLTGTPEEVMEASAKAIEDAGAGGGFILSSGDQPGRDTPDANIFAMVEAAKRFGRYD